MHVLSHHPIPHMASREAKKKSQQKPEATTKGEKNSTHFVCFKTRHGPELELAVLEPAFRAFQCDYADVINHVRQSVQAANGDARAPVDGLDRDALQVALSDVVSLWTPLTTPAKGRSGMRELTSKAELENALGTSDPVFMALKICALGVLKNMPANGAFFK